MGKRTLIVLALALAAVVRCFDTDALVKRMASMITTDEFEALQRGELVAKRAIAPDGKPIDLEKIDLSNPDGHYTCRWKSIFEEQVKFKSVMVVKHHYSTISVLKKIGYTKCGTFGWSSCTRYGVGYLTRGDSYTDYETVAEVQDCPKENIVCESGYIMLSDAKCIALDQINSPLLYDMCRMIKLGLMQHDANSSQLDLPEDCELLKQGR